MDFSVNYNFTANMKNINAGFDNVNKNIDKLGKNMQSVDSKINKTVNTTERLEKANTKSVNSMNKFSDAKIKNIGTAFTKTGKAVENLGKKMVAVSATMATALGTVFKAGMTWESDFTLIAKIVDDGSAKMQRRISQLNEEFLQLSKTIPITRQELVDIGIVAAAVGVPTDDLATFTEWMAKLTVTTNITAKSGAELVTKFFNNMNLRPNTANMKEFVNVMTALSNNMAGRESGTLQIVTMLSQQANLLKISLKDVLALAASFNALNIRPEVARTFFQKTTDSIDEMVHHGGIELQRFTTMMGITQSKFVSIWKKNPFEGYNLFIKRFSKMTNTEMADTYRKFFNSNIRNIATIKQVAGAYKQLELATWVVNNATGSTVAVNREVARKFDTVASKLILVKSNFSALSTHLYQIFEPAIKRSLDGVINSVDKFDRSLKNNQSIIEAFGKGFTDGFVAPFKVVAKVIGKANDALKEWIATTSEARGVSYQKVAEDLGNSLGKIVALTPLLIVFGKGLEVIGGLFPSFYKGARGLNNSVGSLGTNFQKLAPAVGPATTGFQKFASIFTNRGLSGSIFDTSNKIGELKPKVSSLGTTLDTTAIRFSNFTNTLNPFSTSFMGVGNVFKSAGNSAKDLGGNVKKLPNLLSNVTGSFSSLTPIVGGFKAIVSKLPAIIGVALVVGFVSLMATSEQFREKMAEIVQFFVDHKDDIIDWFKRIGTALQPILQVLQDAVSGLIDWIGEHKEDFTGFFEQIANAVEAVAPVVKDVITAIIEVLSSLSPVIDVVIAIIKIAWDVIKGVAGYIAEHFGPVLKDLINIIKWVAKVVGGAIKWFGKLWDALKKGDYEKVKQLFKELFDAIGKGAQEVVNNVVKWFQELPGRIIGAIAGIPKLVGDILGNIFGGGAKPKKFMVEGVTEVIHTVRAEPFSPNVFGAQQGGSNNIHNYYISTKTATNSSDLNKIKQKRNFLNA